MTVVVDTNVPVVANGRSEQASPECVKNCAIRLRQLTSEGKLILDEGWLILREYMANLTSSGQPGTGDAFLKWVLTNYRNPRLCELVKITPKNSAEIDFEEFPSHPMLRGFDPSDRKFIAVAMAHPDKPPVLQATDVEWWEMRGHFGAAGVSLDFLCEDDIRRISASRASGAGREDRSLDISARDGMIGGHSD
jgi:hypothetical protein